MGNREKLLAAARQCLDERGYARTTARDIVALSGTSLAAIGYHFRSTEALLNAALHQAIEAWGDRLAETLAAELPGDAGPAERFEATWTRIVESFGEYRGLWAAQFEMVVQAQHVPDLRDAFAESMAQGRAGLAEQLREPGRPVEKREAELLGSLYQALLSGLLMQWLVDPDRALSGRDLADAVRLLGDRVATTAPARH